MVISCKDGSVKVCRCDSRRQKLMTSHQWPTLHGKGRGRENGCTSVCVSQDGSIMSAGEDGRIYHLSVDSASPLTTIG